MGISQVRSPASTNGPGFAGSIPRRGESPGSRSDPTAKRDSVPSPSGGTASRVAPHSDQPAELKHRPEQ
jgi:hypothetical protein